MTRPRRRRTADAARREILEAAERRLAQSGPAGLRLQDVAADVGISHPAVLHHFGSREGLVHAVIQQAIVGLQQDLVRSLSETQHGDAPDTAALFEHVFETLFDRGHARLMAWLLLSGYDPFNETARANWAQIGQVAHALRLKRVKGKRKPTYEDTLFAIVLPALALFGQAIAGEATFRVAGLDGDPRASRRFRKWLAALLSKHMDS
jgi:TetR/AcrR family transcriptional regulator, repressor for neighboring sulfatase